MSALSFIGRVALISASLGAAYFIGRHNGAYTVLDDIASGRKSQKQAFDEYDIKDTRPPKTALEIFDIYYTGITKEASPDLLSIRDEMTAVDFVQGLKFGFSRYRNEDGSRGYFQRFEERTAVQVEVSADNKVFDFTVIGEHAERYVSLWKGSDIAKLDLSVSRAFADLADTFSPAPES